MIFNLLQNANGLQRHSCALTESEFVSTRTPVILENCEGYEWLKNYNLSLEKLIKVSSFRSLVKYKESLDLLKDVKPRSVNVNFKKE